MRTGTRCGSGRAARRRPIGAGRRSWIGIAFASLAACFGACGPRPSSSEPGRGLLVIAIDALRADHVSALGYDRPTTPVLDGLARQGVLFSDAWSASPEILPAHIALLTGCDPRLARRSDPLGRGPATDLSGWFVPDHVPSLAQELLAQGFETAAFVDHPALSPIRGLAKGFQVYQGFREEAVNPELELGFEGVATKFVHWLTARDAGADWFAYLHVNDLERMWQRRVTDPRWDTLYEPRAELAYLPPVAEAEHAFFAIPRPRWVGGSRSLGEYEARYDGALRQLDIKLGRLFERLRRTDRLRTTTIVVVGSTGISFGEGGLYLDTGGLTAADLRVPCVVRPAAALELPWDQRVRGVTSLTDVAPTLLEMLGSRPPRGMTGVSHAGALRGPAPPARTVAFASGGFQRGMAAVEDRWLFTIERPGDAPTETLALTLHGERFPRRAEPVVGIRARGADGAAEEAAARERLHGETRAWYGWIDRARGLLHGRVAPADDPEIAADLRRRGLL